MNPLQLQQNVCENCGEALFGMEEPNSSSKKGLIYATFGWLFLAVSILFMPFVFGTAAFFMGLMTFLERSQIHGAILVFFAAIITIFGTLFSIFVAWTMFM